jgi:hypothetical protein
MDNPEILASFGTQDEEKQTKNTTQYVLYNTIRKTQHSVCCTTLYVKHNTVCVVQHYT